MSDEYRKKDYSNKEAVSVRVLLRQKEYFLQPFLENSVDSLSKDELNKEIVSFQNFALDRFYQFADCKAKGDAYQHQPFYVTKEESGSALLVESMTKEDIHVSIFRSLEKLPEELSLLQEDFFKNKLWRRLECLYYEPYGHPWHQRVRQLSVCKSFFANL